MLIPRATRGSQVLTGRARNSLHQADAADRARDRATFNAALRAAHYDQTAAASLNQLLREVSFARRPTLSHAGRHLGVYNLAVATDAIKLVRALQLSKQKLQN